MERKPMRWLELRLLDSTLRSTHSTGSSTQLEANHSSFYHAGGHQYNTIHVSNITSSSLKHPRLQRFNDAPTDLLTTHFTGRRKELDFLQEVFSATSLSAPIRCVIYGMPGIGKTILVLQYAFEAFQQGWYSQILWTSGTTVEKLNKDMAKILDLVVHPERYRTEQDAKLTAARLWLERPHCNGSIRWLLLIDNVDRMTLAFLREHLPRTNPQGHILFTTRTADVADALVDITGASHRKLEIHVPDICDITRLFFSGAGIENNAVTSIQRSKAEKLIKIVGSLPLAVVHAASYMKQTHTSLEDILQLYQSERKGEMLQWENDLTSYQEQSVAAAFGALLTGLEGDSPSVSSFLKLLSFLDPERIPLNMLIEGAKRLSQVDALPTVVFPGPMPIALRNSGDHTNSPVTEIRNSTSTSSLLRPLLALLLSPIELMTAIQKLQRLSLVEHLFDNDQSSLRIHDLVQYMISERAKRENSYLEWLQSAISLVCCAFNRVEDPEWHQWWPECEKFIPHIHSLNEKWSDVHGVNLELAKADVGIARYLNSRGRYGEAEVMCKRSVESYEKGCGVEHQDTLDAVDTLARTYYWQERYADAEAACERVCTERKRTLGTDHKDTLYSMNILAVIYTQQGRFSKAEKLLKQVMAGFQETIGPNHRYTFTAMDNLAQVYIDQERFDDAERLFKLTLAGREKKLGLNHIDTLSTGHNLALVYKSQGRCAEAEELYKRTLLAKEQKLGPNHPETLTTASCLAHLYQSQVRSSEAEQCFKRVFTGWVQQLGTDRPGTPRVARDLVKFYRSQGRNSEAQAVLDSLRDV